MLCLRIPAFGPLGAIRLLGTLRTGAFSICLVVYSYSETVLLSLALAMSGATASGVGTRRRSEPMTTTTPNTMARMKNAVRQSMASNITVTNGLSTMEPPP